jgi:hypothetical protein
MSLRPVQDVSEGDWLTDADTALGPAGFEAYVRVLHPWTSRDGGDERIEGHLPEHELAALVGVLAEHTRTPDACFHALWDGYGDIAGGEAVGFLTFAAGPTEWFGRVFTKPKAPPPPPPAFAPEVMDGPRLRVGDRDHLVFVGPLADAGRWGAASYGHGIPRDINSPNLLWPTDHAWCVATDIDTTWTGIGGSAALADDLLADERLEVVRTPYESMEQR